MPRKRRTPKTRRDVPLTPALRHYLMVGIDEHRVAPCRLPGWVDLFATGADAALAAAWCAHRVELIAKARAAGFAPVAAHWFDEQGARLEDADDVPDDDNPARAAWSADFCRQFGY